MRVAVLACAAAALALAGCYESDRLLLDPARAVAPLATGRQEVTNDSGTAQTAEIAREADGWYRVRIGTDAPARVLFTPLGQETDRFAFAVGERGSFLYGVAERRDGRIELDLPFCDLGPARDAAIAHGLKVPSKGAMPPVCSFDDAKNLEGALTDYANRPGDHGKLPSAPAAK